MSSHDVPLQRWRPSVPALTTGWLLCGLFIAFSAMVAYTSDAIADRWFFAALFAAIGAFFGLTGLTHIDLYPDRVVLKSLHPRPRVVALDKVLAARPNRYRLTLQTGRYSWVSGPLGIGRKSPVLEVLRIKNRGDAIADAIVSRAEAFQALHPDQRTELERVAEDLAETLACAGHREEADWLRGKVTALVTGDGATRAAIQRDLHRASVGSIGHLKQIYLGSNGPFFNDRLNRLAALTAER